MVDVVILKYTAAYQNLPQVETQKTVYKNPCKYLTVNVSNREERLERKKRAETLAKNKTGSS